MSSSTVVACRTLKLAANRLGLAGLSLIVLLMAMALVSMQSRAAPPSESAAAPALTPVQPSQFVGAQACKSCHEAEFKAWSGSHHQLAMQAVKSATVLGDFNGVKFKQNDVESTFFKRGDKFMVRTDGPDGKLTDYEIAYTFGVYPLQQYLIAFPGGRYQMLPIAWDSRPKKDGGQRWIHLYPNQAAGASDPLHWTGVYQNWALQCAECHTTNLHKGYDAASNTYKTTYSEINVACESCHGPAGEHIAWANQKPRPDAAQGNIGLRSLRTGWNEAWKFPDANAKVAVREQKADPAGLNSCAACHARRSTISEAHQAGAPLENSHRLAMLTAPNYYADGQQREEVYVWGSFLQSKMFQRGVTCMDCHEPHSQKLRAEGNALCLRCHNANDFETPRHHQHKAGSAGAQCAACHMPTQNYMVIHARQDHSLRVPRPDLSETLGSPNACTQCHRDKRPDWAASAMDKWYGKTWRERASFGPTLHAGATQGALALPHLLNLAKNPDVPGIIRATAVTLAQPNANPGTLLAARELLKDNDPSVRIAALGMVARADPVNRVLSVSPLLSDPMLGVRIEAAQILVDVPDGQIPESRRAARAAAMKEYENALALEADWPSGRVNLGNLRLRQGRITEAVADFKQAIALDPGFTGAYVNLADALRQQGQDSEGEKILRQGIAANPKDGGLHYALGLLLTRKAEKDAAMKEFTEAVRLAPDNARYIYVQAIALNSAGRRDEALAVLRHAQQQFPGNMEIINALFSMSREAGDNPAALRYAKLLADLMPDNANLRRLILELEKP